MADELRIGLQELLNKAQIEHETDFLRESVRVLSQALMELEVEEHIDASRHERTPEQRTGQRNGYRDRSWDTRVGTVELRSPENPRWRLLPLIARASQEGRAGTLGSALQEAYPSMGSPPARWRNCYRLSGDERHLQEPGLQGLRGA